MKIKNVFHHIVKGLAYDIARLIVFPGSYRYHLLLNAFLGILNERLVLRCVKLYGNNTKEQFERGKVYEYKSGVRFGKNNDIIVNADLARNRINDIFLNEDVVKYLKVNGKGRLLEIGCEAGQNLSVIHEVFPDMKLHGCDISGIALSKAEKSGFDVIQLNLLQSDPLEVYQDNQFDYVLLSHVFEHLLCENAPHSMEIRKSVIRHIHRISRLGYVITTSLVSANPQIVLLEFLGHSRIALGTSPSEMLDQIGVTSFLVGVNKRDDSLSIIVRKSVPGQWENQKNENPASRL